MINTKSLTDNKPITESNLNIIFITYLYELGA